MRYPNSETNLDGFGSSQFPHNYPTPGIRLPLNPFHSGGPFDPKRHCIPRQEPALPIPMINLEPSSVTFLERLQNGLGEDAPSGVYRVKINGMGERLLKIVSTDQSISRA